MFSWPLLWFSSLYFISLHDPISSSSRFHLIAESIAYCFRFRCRPVPICYPVLVPVCFRPVSGFICQIRFCLTDRFPILLDISNFVTNQFLVSLNRPDSNFACQIQFCLTNQFPILLAKSSFVTNRFPILLN